MKKKSKLFFLALVVFCGFGMFVSSNLNPQAMVNLKLNETSKPAINISESINNIDLSFIKEYEKKEKLKQKQKLIKLQKQKEAKQKRQKVTNPSRGKSIGNYQLFEATAYAPTCNGCSGITSTGIDVRNTIYHKGMRVIAVDPRVIPYHSVVMIKYGNQRFKAIALDTGGAIKGNRIDLLFKTEKECKQFGRRMVEVMIL